MRFAIVKILANQISETKQRQRIYNFNIEFISCVEKDTARNNRLVEIAYEIVVNFVRKIVAKFYDDCHKDRPVEIRLYATLGTRLSQERKFSFLRESGTQGNLCQHALC